MPTQQKEYGYFPHSYFGETYFPAVWFAPAMVEIDEHPPSGGSGNPSGIWWGERKIKRGKKLDDILKKAMDQIVKGDVEIEPDTVVAKAVAVVKPHIEVEKHENTEPISKVDWDAVEADLKKVKELLRLWQEQIEAIEEEDLILLAAYEYYY